jgi:hypothetical protein
VASALRRTAGESIFTISILLPDEYRSNRWLKCQKILDLVTAMEHTYSFTVSADELKNHPVVQDIVEQILKQGIECRYFIQEYARRNFGGTSRVSNNIWLGNC